MRLIDPVESVKAIDRCCAELNVTDSDEMAIMGSIKNMLMHFPTIDAVPVVHGRWIPLEADGYADGYPVYDLWECSECREEHSGDEDTLTPYCPACGAKLEVGYEYE